MIIIFWVSTEVVHCVVVDDDVHVTSFYPLHPCVSQ